MLSDNALDVALALRKYIGADTTGVGPEIAKLVTLVEKAGAELLSALNELEQLGFVRVNRGQGKLHLGIPKELRGIVGVAVLEPLQVYLDELGP